MINLKGKVALITGGSRGIGKSIALKFASIGANIAINYLNDEAEALQVKEEIEKFGVKCIVAKCDVSNFDDAHKLIDEVVKEYSRIDILINNAGITKDNLLMKMKEQDFDSVIAVNLKGVYNCTKAAIKPMMKQRYGKIVNMASVVGIIGNPGQANYCASKAGVIGFTKAIAKEIASRNINVNAVAPGFIDTDMTKVLKDEVKDYMLRNIPLQKFGTPEDISNLVAFLSSDISAYITGQVINVDGGMVM